MGGLTTEWSRRTGLPPGIPVAVGAFDAHLGGVGSGIAPGALVKIIGTSTCDMMVVSQAEKVPDIPGLCGIVNGSILPNYYGLEAGQSAVGDIFNWFVNYLQPLGKKNGSHEALSSAASRLKPGESGLLALDWNNGNRTVLVDQRLTGLLLGQTLYTTPSNLVGFNGLAFSPDSKRIASSTVDGMQIWDATTGENAVIYPGHFSWVYAVAWAQSGQYIASASSDKTVQVWLAV